MTLKKNKPSKQNVFSLPSTNNSRNNRNVDEETDTNNRQNRIASAMYCNSLTLGQGGSSSSSSSSSPLDTSSKGMTEPTANNNKDNRNKTTEPERATTKLMMNPSERYWRDLSIQTPRVTPQLI